MGRQVQAAEHTQIEEMQRAALTIQRAWRLYCVRKALRWVAGCGTQTAVSCLSPCCTLPALSLPPAPMTGCACMYIACLCAGAAVALQQQLGRPGARRGGAGCRARSARGCQAGWTRHLTRWSRWA